MALLLAFCVLFGTGCVVSAEEQEPYTEYEVTEPASEYEADYESEPPAEEPKAGLFGKWDSFSDCLIVSAEALGEGFQNMFDAICNLPQALFQGGAWLVIALISLPVILPPLFLALVEAGFSLFD